MIAYHETREPPHCPTCDCGGPGRAVELALGKVLRAAGIKLTSCSLAMQEKMREAMREVVSDAYIKGSNDCHAAFVATGKITK